MKNWQINWQKERLANQYWIDRGGKCHFFTGSEEDAEELISIHYAIAADLFPEIKYPNDPEAYIEKLGWIKMGSSVYNCPIIINKNPTRKQKNKLFELGERQVTIFWKGELHGQEYFI